MQIGGYEVEAELARGGNAVVYLATDPRLRRRVAIKVIPGQQDAPSRRRFAREAAALGRLDHPHIVAVHAGGEEQGHAYLVLDYVDGATLDDRLMREGRVPWREAARITRQLADAVQYAHEHGVLHRDIKPSNVLLRDGVPLLTDFGLARELDAPVENSVSVRGRFLGTPGFCPPEQARGELERVGPASDVYGLGALLYASLTAAPPFEGSSLVEALVATIETTPTPPSERGVELPPDLEAVCLRCLAKAPEDRYASAQELSLDLGRVLEGRRLGWSSQARAAATPAAGSGRSAMWIGLALAASIGVGVVIGSTIEPGTTPAPAPARSPTAPALPVAAELERLRQQAQRAEPYQRDLERRFAALAERAGSERARVEELLVRYLFDSGRYTAALERAEVAEARGALSPGARLKAILARGHLRLAAGERPSMHGLTALSQEHADAPVGWVARGIELASAHRAEQALELGRRARRAAPELPEAWDLELSALLGLKQLQEAGRVAAEAARRFPTDTQVRARCLTVACQLQQAPDALAHAQVVLARLGDAPPAHLSRSIATALMLSRRFREAFDVLSRGDPAGVSFDTRLLRGMILRVAERPAEGNRVLSILFMEDPRRVESQLRKNATASQVELLLTGLKTVQTTFNDTPKRLAFLIGELRPEVLTRLRRRAEAAPEPARGPLFRALVLAARAASWDAIERPLREARTRAPRSPEVALETLRLALGRDALAPGRAALQRAQDLVSDREVRWELERLGAVLEIRSDRARGLERLRQLVEHASGPERAIARAWQRYVDQDREGAEAAAREALRLDPEHLAARSLLVQITWLTKPRDALENARHVHDRIGALDGRMVAAWMAAGVRHLLARFAKTGRITKPVLAGGLHLSREATQALVLSELAAPHILICGQYLRFQHLRRLPPTVPLWIQRILKQAIEREPSTGVPHILLGALALRTDQGPEAVLRHWRRARAVEPRLVEPRDWTAQFLRRYPSHTRALRELWPARPR